MDEKQTLIEKVINDPNSFNDSDFDTLVHLPPPDSLSFEDLRKMIMRLYDINEDILEEDSDATTGLLGALNKYSNKKRMKKYNNRTKNKIRYKPGCKTILAEGDSWFEFPFFICDIIDWLNCENPDFAVYCIAYGGDWITNIIYEEKYIAELPIHAPDFFLISGGGNDLVGSNRLAIMVNRINNNHIPPNWAEKYPNEFKNDFSIALRYINKEFFSFIITIKLQYYLMFAGIKKKYPDMKILTQGYDYPIPTFARRFSIQYPHQPLINWLIDSGKWLKRPLCIKGIPETESGVDVHSAIMKLFIYEINEMFIALANKNDKNGQSEFPNLFHIDCRGIAKGFDDWFDELHLKSHVYKKISNAYSKFINDEIKAENKTIKVTAVN